MAIALLNTPAVVGVAGTTTVSAGVSTVLVAFANTLFQDISFVTANGINMTKIGPTEHFFSTADEYISMWVLPDPPVGAVTMNWSPTPTDNRGFLTAVFSGVNLVNPVDNANLGYSTVTGSQTTSVSVVASNCWMIGCGNFTGGNMTGGTGVFTVCFGSGAAFLYSNGTIGTGSQSGGYTTSGVSTGNGLLIAALQPNLFVTVPSVGRHVSVGDGMGRSEFAS